MAKYAADTTVSVEKSEAEIKQVLKRYGADLPSFGWADEHTPVLGFRYEGRFVRLELKLPLLADFAKDSAGRTLPIPLMHNRYNQEVRRRYRVLKLMVTSKLELVDEGAETFDQAFMPYTLLPDGRTVYEAFAEQVGQSYITGAMPRFLLPAGKE